MEEPRGHTLHQGHWEYFGEKVINIVNKFSGNFPVYASAHSSRTGTEVGSLIFNSIVGPHIIEVR